MHNDAKCLKAARALGGIPSTKKLAEEIAAKKLLDTAFGIGTIDGIERGVRTLKEHEARAVAKVCGLPYEFFTADLQRLPELDAASQPADLEDRLQRIEEIVLALKEFAEKSLLNELSRLLDEAQQEIETEHSQERRKRA